MTTDAVYIPVDLRSLHSDCPLACDLYVEVKGQYVLYRESSLPFAWADRKRLLAGGLSNLWVRVTGEEDTRAQQQLTALLAEPDEKVPPVAKAGLLYTSAKAVAERAIANSGSPQSIAAANELVGSTVSYLARSQNAFQALLTVMLHDFSLYTHAVNVAVYAVALGRYIGIADRQALQNLGMGAVLHDIGKARVPTEVLCKPGKLSPEEWDIMRQHPDWGREMLSGAVGIPETALTVIEQHHERIDGSGYPRGLSGDNIDLLSRLVAVVDSYDALTSHRHYRSAQTPFYALSLLRQDIPTKLDSALFTSLVHLLGNSSLS